MYRYLCLGWLAAAWLLPKPALAMPAEPSVRQACVRRQVQNLPIPFADLDPDHWAFAAVMRLYYCGAYRGGIPPADPTPR